MARSYTPLADLARLAMERRELDSVRALARLIDLEGDEQHRVYAWLRPGARGSYAGTVALLEELEMLTPEALAFLKQDHPGEPEAGLVDRARQSAAAGRSVAEQSEQRRPRRGAA